MHSLCLVDKLLISASNSEPPPNCPSIFHGELCRLTAAPYEHDIAPRHIGSLAVHFTRKMALFRGNDRADVV